MILDGRAVAREILESLEIEIAEGNFSRPPNLVVVVVGNNSASAAYIRMKKKRAEEIGMNCAIQKFDETISESDLQKAVKMLSLQKNIDGIIVQLPLPNHINAHKIIEAIDPKKDVDGFTQEQIGNMFLAREGLYSCTPKGIMRILSAHKIGVEGKNLVIIGRSNIVGKPLSILAINAGATVTVCNSKTKNLAEITKKADIIVVAIGRANFLTKEMVSSESVIIDVGSNWHEGKFVGDVDFGNVSSIVRAITPSPGGVGPMTIAMLLENTFLAYKKHLDG